MLLEPRTPWPARVDVAPRRPPRRRRRRAVVTFIGHSTFLIQTAAGNILTDPMYSRRAGPFTVLGPRRVRQPAVRFDDLPPISIVLLSHNHYDHCDLPTLRRLAQRFDPLVVTPLGNGRLVRSAGIRRVEELDWWQETDRRRAADHADAGAALLGADAVRSQPRAVGRLRRRRPAARGSTSPATPATRPFFREIGAAARSDRPRAAADRRLRAALVHEGGSHESGGSGAGASRPRRGREHRHALRHLPADRPKGSTSRCARSTPPCAREVFRPRGSTRCHSGGRRVWSDR